MAKGFEKLLLALILWTLIVIIALIQRANATQYYVDAIYGLDTNTTNAPYPGPAGTGPWQTAAKMAAPGVIINAGDIISFKGGPNEVYRPSATNHNWVYKANGGGNGFAGTATNPVWVTSYGEGPAPTIAGSDCIGAQVGACTAGPIIGGNSWAVAGGGFPPTIYKEAWTIKPYALYIDGEAGYPSLRSATCLVNTCASVSQASGAVTIATRLPFWVTSHAYTSGNAVQNAGNWYTAGSTATSGATAPTCTSATCSDGTITWTYQGRSSAVILAMAPGSWFWDGAFLYIWMPAGDSPANHSLEVSDVAATVLISPAGSEQNGVTYDHLTIKHGCIGWQLFANNASGAASTIGIQNSTIVQGGTGPADTGEGCRDTVLNGAGGLDANAITGAFMRNNRIGYSSNAALYGQCTHNMVIEGNDVGPGPGTHGGIQFPQSGTCLATGNQFIGNVVHDALQSPSNIFGVVNGQPNGIYVEASTPTTLIAKNIIFSMNDPGGCANYAQPFGCGGIQISGGTGGAVIGNVIDQVNSGFVANSAPTNLLVRDNIVNAKPGPGANLNYAVGISTTCASCTFDHNNWWEGPAASQVVAKVNGVNETFAQWQALGNDPNGLSADPILALPSSEYWLAKKLEVEALEDEASGGNAGISSSGGGGGGASLLGTINTWTALNTFNGGFTNNCKGTVTLAAGNATATNTCIAATGIPVCFDITVPGTSGTCTPANGSMAVTGTGTHIIAWLIAG